LLKSIFPFLLLSNGKLADINLSTPCHALPDPFSVLWTLDLSSPGGMITTNGLLTVHLNLRRSALDCKTKSATAAYLLACDLIQTSELPVESTCVWIAIIQTTGLQTKS
jgi:hypothetical protein